MWKKHALTYTFFFCVIGHVWYVCCVVFIKKNNSDLMFMLLDITVPSDEIFPCSSINSVVIIVLSLKSPSDVAWPSTFVTLSIFTTSVVSVLSSGVEVLEPAGKSVHAAIF